MRLLIAFCGNGRYAGKNTAAGFVQEWCDINGFPYFEKAFASAGKELIAKSLGLEGNPVEVVDRFKMDGGLSVEHSEGEGHHILGRDYIINVLEGVRDLFGSDFWTDAILPAFPDPLVIAKGVTVITDLRFPTEAERVIALKGYIVEIHRDSAEPGKSEGVLAESDLYKDIPSLDNNGTLEALRAQIFGLMTGLTKVW
jgi:hypothetical protein